MRTALKIVGDSKIWLRLGTSEPSSDEQAADEVLARHAYVRPRLGFDVLPGEKWLDLGSNVGAFAVFCRDRGAAAVCFEPEPGCFKLLQKNVPTFRCYNIAVTASHEPQLSFVKSKNPENNYRGTVLPVEKYEPHGAVQNLYAGDLPKYCGQSYGNGFDGIKMDIEGSEGPLIDEWLLPRCSKLVMEYHTSRWPSPEDLERRLKILRAHFKEVRYPKCFDTLKGFPPRYDQLVFCIGER